VARLSLAARAEADLDRIHAFIAAHDPRAATAAVDLILDALDVLERHPMIGRPVHAGLRELVISQGKTGYVALYEYFRTDDAVLVVALRHQREAGFSYEA
jgi:plasmid stabilization system protein ParE